MNTTIRIMQAPSELMPELARSSICSGSISPVARVPRVERYLTGLLTELPNKNCDTIARNVPGTSEQRLQGLLTAMAWDEDDLNRQRVEQMLELPSEGDGVLIVDDTGFAKQGKGSVGVARQYSGTLGKVGNCQVTVNAHYANAPVSGRSPHGCTCWRSGLVIWLGGRRRRSQKRSPSKPSWRSPWTCWTELRLGGCAGSV